MGLYHRDTPQGHRRSPYSDSGLLDPTITVFPGTRLRLRFAVHPPPRTGLAFPGTPAGRGTGAASAVAGGRRPAYTVQDKLPGPGRRVID